MGLEFPYCDRSSAWIAIGHKRFLCLLMGISALTAWQEKSAQAIEPLQPRADRLPEQIVQRSPAPDSTQLTLWVNAQTGNDHKADGSQQSPFQTLTRALEAAQPHSIIQLAAGTYSTNSGEIFPILLKPGVIVQGNSDKLGQDVIIRGGGSYSSSTAGRQNVTLVGASQATLSGVTVTNPYIRGNGFWVEAGNPTIRDCTFTNNPNAGVVAMGSSTPIVQNNLFILNRVNGMMIGGHAQPELQNNIFQRTGTGIAISENAAPQILSNRISQNRTGIAVQGNANPVLRNNTIEDSDQDGLVAMAQSQPNLGTVTAPGHNTFLNNRQHDINALTTSQKLPAFGNQLSADRLAGNLDLTGKTPIVSVTTIASTADRLPTTQARFLPTQTATVSASDSSAAPVLISSLPPTRSRSDLAIADKTQQPSAASSAPSLNSAAGTPNRSRTPSQAAVHSPTVVTANLPNPASRTSSQPRSQAAINISVPPPEQTSVQTAAQSVRFNSIRSSASSSVARPAVEINVPPPAASRATAITPIASRTPIAPTAAPTRTASAARAIEITVPPPEQPVASTTALPQFATVAVAAAASLPRLNPSNSGPTVGGVPISIPVPPPEQSQTVAALSSASSNATTVSAAPGSVAVLPVPTAEIPVGNTGDMPKVRTANANFASIGGIVNADANLQYRVVVEANDDQVPLVQSLVPEAFTTSVNGRSMLQIGAFSSRDNAQEAVELLSRNGLQGIIQPIE